MNQEGYIHIRVADVRHYDRREFFNKDFIRFRMNNFTHWNESIVFEPFDEPSARIQNVFDILLKNIWIEWLFDVKIGTGFQPLEFIVHPTFGGEQNNWYVRGVYCRFYFTGKLKPVHFRHHHIADNEFRGKVFKFFQSFKTIGGGINLEFLFEGFLHKIEQFDVVFHNQHDRVARSAI